MDRIFRLTVCLRPQEPTAGRHPFPVQSVSRTSSLTFNISSYSWQLLNDFLVEGGKIEHVQFHTPAELTQIAQKTIINAIGYGARALRKIVVQSIGGGDMYKRRTARRPKLPSGCSRGCTGG